MVKEKIILIGGGGHCKSCIDVIEQEARFEIAGIVDVAANIGKDVLGYQIIAADSDLDKLAKEYKNYIITLGFINNPKLRIKIFNKLRELKVEMPVIISPRAYVSKHCRIGEGTIVMHDCVVNACAEVGDNCIINTKSLVEHDAKIGDNCHISTASVVNGGVEVGEGTFYGSGAVSKQYISIEPYSFIKANSIVKGNE